MKYLWTSVEEGMLIQLAALGKTNAEIAEKLGRTKSAVAHKRSRLFMLMPEEPDIKAEEPDIKAEEPEEPDGEGTTGLEIELKNVRELLGKITSAIVKNAESIDSSMTAVTERVNELSQRQTVLEDDVAELKKRMNLIAENISQINIYLSLGPRYRLFHSFRKFREARNRG